MWPVWLGLMLALVSGIKSTAGSSITYRIVNGTNVVIGDYPFMVSVQHREDDTDSHICGGTWLSELWILTAAHCILEIEEPNTGVVRVGSSFHASGGHLLTINRTVRHKDMRYDFGIDYDFGLIKLNERFEQAVPVRLMASFKRFPAGTMCKTIGWGLTKRTGDREQLRMVKVPIVRQGDCDKAYTDIETITSRMLCAGYKDGERDACDGDSGGPLICHGIQVGITSWALGCAKPNRYGVYSNIANQREWIRTHTGL